MYFCIPVQIQNHLGKRKACYILSLNIQMLKPNRFFKLFLLIISLRFSKNKQIAKRKNCVSFVQRSNTQGLCYQKSFCTNIKKSGGKVIFTDASKVSTCRMYDSAKSVWEGFSKNIYEGLGRKTTTLFGVISLYYTSSIIIKVTKNYNKVTVIC